MRQNPNAKRSRGRSGRKGATPRSQVFDSNGPSVRVRGNAMQVYEKYTQLARDATSSGDRVGAENLQQHAEHYYRIMSANAARNAEREGERRGPDGRPNGRDAGADGDGNSSMSLPDQADAETSEAKVIDTAAPANGAAEQASSETGADEATVEVVTPVVPVIDDEGDSVGDGDGEVAIEAAKRDDLPPRRSHRSRQPRANHDHGERANVNDGGGDGDGGDDNSV